MTDLVGSDSWSNVYQFETTDLIQGGPGGIDNRPTQELTNRTERIKSTLALVGVDVMNKIISEPNDTNPAPVRKSTSNEVSNGLDVAAFINPKQLKDQTLPFVSSMANLKITNPTPANIVFMTGYVTPGDKGSGFFVWDGLSTATPNDGTIIQVTGVTTGRWKRIYSNELRTEYFGDVSDVATNTSTLVQNVINFAEFLKGDTNTKFIQIKLRQGGVYRFDTGIFLHHGLRLDANGSLIQYYGTNYCVQLGNHSHELNYYNQFTNFSIQLMTPNNRGVWLYGTTEAYVHGLVQGYYGNFDTRTNYGVHVDGMYCSAFMNVISVNCNHVHKSFVIGTSGTVQPTNQMFINCSALGDQGYYDGNNDYHPMDETSYGWVFEDTGIPGTGDGTKLINCNIEAVNIGIYFGDGTRGVHVDARWEIKSTPTSRTVKFNGNTNNIVLNGAGLDCAQIGAVPGGIEGFDTGKHQVLSDQYGNVRIGGNACSFADWTQPIFAIGHEIIALKEDANVSFISKDNSDGRGSIFMQPGVGSSSTGAFIKLFGNDHQSADAKNLQLGPSQGGEVQITRGFGLPKMAQFDYKLSGRETSLWLVDATNPTVLKRVKVSNVDMVEPGHRALIVEN